MNLCRQALPRLWQTWTPAFCTRVPHVYGSTACAQCTASAHQDAPALLPYFVFPYATPQKTGEGGLQQIGAINRGTTLSRCSARLLTTQLPTGLGPKPQTHISFGCCTVESHGNQHSLIYKKNCSPSGLYMVLDQCQGRMLLGGGTGEIWGETGAKRGGGSRKSGGICCIARCGFFEQCINLLGLHGCVLPIVHRANRVPGFCFVTGMCCDFHVHGSTLYVHLQFLVSEPRKWATSSDISEAFAKMKESSRTPANIELPGNARRILISRAKTYNANKQGTPYHRN